MKPPKLNWRSGTRLVLASGTVFAACFSSQAYSQAWLPDRGYTEGPGIRAGNVEIHPGVAVRGGYDNNVFRADGEQRTAVINGEVVDVTQRELSSAILAVTPHIHLSTLSAQRQAGGEDRGEEQSLPPLSFRGGASATYLHYFREGAPRSLEIDTDLQLAIMPQRPVNVELRAAYTRMVRPFTQYAGRRSAYDRNLIQPRARLNFGSRSKVLTAYVGYAPSISIYESSVFDYLNSVAHGVEVGSFWKFLPNTALVYDGAAFFQRYNQQNPVATRSPVLFEDTTTFRTRLGINGAITQTLNLRILAGYGAIAYNDDTLLDEHEDVIGEAVLSWQFGPGQTSRFDVGYHRDINASAMGGWVRSDRGSITFRSLLGRVFLLQLDGNAGRIRYGKLWGFTRTDPSSEPVVAPLGVNGETFRKDTRLEGSIRGEYRITNWLALLADFTVHTIITDFDYASQLLLADRPVSDPAGYFTWMAFGGIRVHY